jgi:colanic acid biosynthesis protein WcaH
MPPNFLSHAELDAVIRLAPLVAINLIIRNARSEVLLGLRTNEPAKDRYFVPGRMITKNERLAEASARIVKNETGRAAKFEDARLLGVFEHFYDNNRSGKAGYGTHYVVLGYQLEWRRSPTTNTASCAGGPSPNWHRTACTKIPSLFSGWSAVLKPR